MNIFDLECSAAVYYIYGQWW